MVVTELYIKERIHLNVIEGTVEWTNSRSNLSDRFWERNTTLLFENGGNILYGQLPCPYKLRGAQNAQMSDGTRVNPCGAVMTTAVSQRRAPLSAHHSSCDPNTIGIHYLSDSETHVLEDYLLSSGTTHPSLPRFLGAHRSARPSAVTPAFAHVLI